jgi:type VI secretion system protein ImpF
VSYQPHRVTGLRAPLFDRLVDSAPEERREVSPPRIYGYEAVRLSIARDLQRLLNTRRAPAPFTPHAATVLDYGVPEFSHLSASSATDRHTLAELLRAAIVAFEPRLQDVSVTLEPDPRTPSGLLGYIASKVRLGSFLEPVTFPVILNSSHGEVEILAAETHAAVPPGASVVRNG